jgi:hypothetical protein
MNFVNQDKTIDCDITPERLNQFEPILKTLLKSIFNAEKFIETINHDSRNNK